MDTTPGPWVINRVHEVIVETVDGDCVCEAYLSSADARLIAAAPEMYELLTRVSESNVSPLRNQSRALLARIDGDSDDSF